MPFGWWERIRRQRVEEENRSTGALLHNSTLPPEAGRMSLRGPRFDSQGRGPGNSDESIPRRFVHRGPARLKYGKRLLSLTVAMAVGVLPQLASGETESAFVFLSPDSNLRYRPAIDRGGSTLVLADIDTITPPALSNDGTLVAFSGAVGDESTGRYAIFVVNTNGSGLSQVTSGSFGELDPTWSPNQQNIAFSRNTSGRTPPDLCCELATVNVDTGIVNVLTSAIGVTRPSYSPDGSMIVYDTPDGVWKIPASGGLSTRLAAPGYDATVAPDGLSVAFLVDVGSSTELRIISINGGPGTTIYSTPRDLEAPHWKGDRIFFFEYEGTGYDGRSNVLFRSVAENGGSLRTDRHLSSSQIGLDLRAGNDEVLFYKDNGIYSLHNVSTHADIGSPIQSGSGFSTGWSVIASIDLNGDGSDEILFYRAADGTFKYYDMHQDGRLGSLIRSGTGYETGWSSITSIDLDGDGQDEILFYREDGAFRYYNIGPTASLGSPIQSGSGYTQGWTSLTAVDVDG
jgi:hypothetical protein